MQIRHPNPEFHREFWVVIHRDVVQSPVGRKEQLLIVGQLAGVNGVEKRESADT